MTLFAATAITPKNVYAENYFSKDQELDCVDSSITVGDRIIWSLLRGTSKSPQELMCEKTLVSRQIYLDQDKGYISNVVEDKDYRFETHVSDLKNGLVAIDTPQNPKSEPRFIERYETKTFRLLQSDDERKRTVETLQGYKTLVPSTQ